MHISIKLCHPPKVFRTRVLYWEWLLASSAWEEAEKPGKDMSAGSWGPVQRDCKLGSAKDQAWAWGPGSHPSFRRHPFHPGWATEPATPRCLLACSWQLASQPWRHLLPPALLLHLGCSLGCGSAKPEALMFHLSQERRQQPCCRHPSLAAGNRMVFPTVLHKR